jgi:hypothetical protein
LRGGAGSVGWRGEEEERKGEGEADRPGPRVSARGEKEKGEEERWAGAGVGRRAAGPSGLKGEPARFSFFLFLFQTSFSNHFSFQIQIKLFKLFLKNFINFLETTQATKNHASQLMMHKHLLSLSLLNYI